VVTDDTLYRISPVEAGATYYTRVRSINSLGVKSAFVTANQVSIGDTTAPALPTPISATAGYKSISLEWTNPSDKDFSNVEVYRATSSGGSFSEVATVGC
jgi:predicted phage tail protein